LRINQFIRNPYPAGVAPAWWAEPLKRQKVSNSFQFIRIEGQPQLEIKVKKKQDINKARILS